MPFSSSVQAVSGESALSGGATDRAIDALLMGINWGTSVFHVGQYCGRWRASTESKALASFHLVLRGHCWLHRPGLPSFRLASGSGVFLMRDAAHFLSPYEDAAIDCSVQPMARLTSELDDIGSTGLACGFFNYDGPMQGIVASWMPDALMLAADDPATAGTGALFALMRQEAIDCPVEGSPLLDRLAGLLFFYVLRAAARAGKVIGGPLALLRSPVLSPLVLELIADPEYPWTVEEMAQRVHLSRAALFRQFALAGEQSPSQLLLHIRMQLAAQRLARGESITRVCEAVGYDSPGAFARAFKRVTGVQPGAWQRESGVSGTSPISAMNRSLSSVSDSARRSDQKSRPSAIEPAAKPRNNQGFGVLQTIQ